MGLCINLFGIPLIEDGACAAKRREQRNEKKSIEEASDVAKKQAAEEGHSENVYNRNQQQLGSSIARNYGTGEGAGGFVGQGFDFLGAAVSGGNELAGNIFGSGGAGSTIAGAYLTGGTSLLGGLGGLLGGTAPDGTTIPPSPLVPVAVVGIGVALAYLATR